MPRRFRGLVGALAACALLATSAAPASAYSGRIGQEPDAVPVLLDMLLLRPLGLVMTGVGFLGFAVTAPLVLVTRPTNIKKPFAIMVANPARFTFVDQLGYHPDRLNASYGVIE